MVDLTKLDPRVFRMVRDAILFVAGLAGIAYETLVAGADRPTLLVMFGAMVGLPAFLRTDEKKKPPDPDPPPAAPPEPRPKRAEPEAEPEPEPEPEVET